MNHRSSGARPSQARALPERVARGAGRQWAPTRTRQRAGFDRGERDSRNDRGDGCKRTSPRTFIFPPRAEPLIGALGVSPSRRADHPQAAMLCSPLFFCPMMGGATDCLYFFSTAVPAAATCTDTLLLLCSGAGSVSEQHVAHHLDELRRDVSDRLQRSASPLPIEATRGSNSSAPRVRVLVGWFKVP
jgi:hypothetical protein